LKRGRAAGLRSPSSSIPPSELGGSIEAPAACTSSSGVLGAFRRVNSAAPLKLSQRYASSVEQSAFRRVNSAAPLKPCIDGIRDLEGRAFRRVNSAAPLKLLRAPPDGRGRG